MSAEDIKDYYRVLGVRSSATVSEIHNAYWQRASSRHPDKGGSHEEMVQLVEAWKILSDPDKRARYDQLTKSRHDGWRSRQFNEDVREARNRAKDDTARSWSEFEAIYQKAFYVFNQDFYGKELDEKAAGPYSPLLLLPKKSRLRGAETLKSGHQGNASNTTGGTMIVSVIKVVIILTAMIAAFLFYRNFRGIGRFVPLGQQESASIRIMDTATGTIYSVEKRDGAFFPPWKKTVPPVPSEKK